MSTEIASDNATTILDLAAQVGKALQDKGLILATAESCTCLLYTSPSPRD